MRTISVLALVAWAVGVPGALRAADLTFALSGQTEYDSNIFRSSEDEQDDFLFRIRPWVRLHDDRGQDLTYSLRYMMPVEFAVSNSRVDDVDQHVSGNVAYNVNDRWQLFASDTFRFLRSELFTDLEETGPGGDASLVNQERDRITLNDASLGTSYDFTPRMTGSARLEHSFYDPSRDDRQQTSSISGTSDLTYLVTPRHRLGGGVMIAHQDFDETQDIVASTTDAYQVFGSWLWAIDEKTEFSISAGPSLLRGEQDDPDATDVRGLVPFVEIDRSFTAPNGFVDRFGGDVSGDVYPNGVVLVGRVSNCAQLSDGTPVLSSGVSCPQTVVLDATPFADTVLINAIRSATATLVNPDPNGEDSTDLTVFAQAVITRHWTPNLHSALRYSRRQDTASGLGGSVVNDSVSLSNTWNMTEKWQFAFRGDWSQRNSISEATRVLVVAQPVMSPLGGEGFTVDLAGVATGDMGTGLSLTQRSDETRIDTMRYGFAGRATHFFTRNTSGYVQFTYNRQTSQSDSLGDPSDFQNYLATIGVQHVFAPIKLW